MRNLPVFSFLRCKAPALLVGLLVCGQLFSGCGGKKFSDGDIRTVDGVYHGIVIDVSDVIVEEDPSVAVPLTGAAVGGLLGAAFGPGSGRWVYAIGGAALGAGISESADTFRRRYKATQITMELDNGGALVVVQGNDEYFVRGDKVRIISLGDDRARVQHE
jgi:outer membrane lipoprotein SlyB